MIICIDTYADEAGGSVDGPLPSSIAAVCRMISTSNLDQVTQSSACSEQYQWVKPDVDMIWIGVSREDWSVSVG